MVAASTDIVVNVKSNLEPYLEQMRALAIRMEAAAAAMGEPIEGELVEMQPGLASEASALGPLAVAIVGAAALAGSTTKHVTRRSVMTLGFLRRN